jgi:isopentenyl-diphosphate delta-isomerase
MTTVILVDEQNHPMGTMDLKEAHTGKGHLHRAFSIYVFRNAGSEILIQKRSAGKLLWPGIWANTCCSHPREQETALQAAERRLQEECNFVCDLSEDGSFVYRAEDPGGRGVEHEHVTLLRGRYDVTSLPHANPEEIDELRWITVNELQKDMAAHPDAYAPWFHLGLQKVLE